MSKIDVHHHFYPDIFTAALKKAGGDPSGWTVPSWTLEADQALGQDLGIHTAILSVTAPGPSVESDPKAAAALARACNEAGASIRDAHPANYGFFASVPSLLDTDLALAEIAYSFDTLKADGVVLMTRYGNDNHYLGHRDFIPIWDELARRRAVVFIHPTHGVDKNLVNPHLPQPMFDYPHETGRTAIDMILSNTMPRVQKCKIILSHAGGTLPYLIDRVAGMIPHTPFSVGKSTSEIFEEASQFYYDTALSSNPSVLDLVIKLAKPGHVLFGSDFPNAPTEGIKYYTKQLEAYLSDKAEKNSLEHEAAWELFPRLRKYWS